MSKILPPPSAGGRPVGRGGPPGESWTKDKLELRAKNMRQEWMADPNEKELLLSMDEVLAAPDATKIIVANSIDYCTDCKPDELKSTVKMILALHKARKVGNEEIKAAMTDLVEFSDSYVCDNPRMFDYIGDMFCAFANNSVLTVGWLCDCASRVGEEGCRPKLIACSMKSLKKEFGDGAVKECFGGASDRAALQSLLGPVKFQEMAKEFL